MDYQKFFDTGKLLFERFGWYSVLLVIATTLIMIPVNMLYKKIMKNESLSRLRKTISSVSVYIVAMGLIAFFTGVVIREPITFGYLFTSSMNCGLLSMLLWAIIKLVRDCGVSPIINAILSSKQAKAWMKEYGLSEKLVEVAREEVSKYMKDKKLITLEDFLQKELDIKSHLRLQMSGFVTSDKVNDVITNILQPIKAKLK